MTHRYDILHKVLTLDPQKDCQEIVFLVGSYEYPFLMVKALEFALFRTYAVPSISALLAKTGRFEHAGQRRYDDTSLLISEFVEEGYDSVRGRAAIRQMNRLHQRFTISNDDYLYVLSTFVFTPIYFHRQFGWRTPTQHENIANFTFWHEVGKRMNIEHLPATIEEFEAFHRAYERDNSSMPIPTAKSRTTPLPCSAHGILRFCRRWCARLSTPSWMSRYAKRSAIPKAILC